MNNLEMPIVPVVANCALYTPSSNQTYFEVSRLSSAITSKTMTKFYEYFKTMVNVHYDRIRYGVAYTLYDVRYLLPENVQENWSTIERKVTTQMVFDGHKAASLNFSYNGVVAFSVRVLINK